MLHKLILLSALVLAVKSDGEQYLASIRGYAVDTFFKEDVYTTHNWKSFYSLPEANEYVKPGSCNYHLLNAALFFATNKQRQKSGRSALIYDKRLRDAAALHTHEMVSRNFFDHYNRKNRQYYDPGIRLALFGVTNKPFAENCDYNYSQDGEKTYIEIAELIVKDFMQSSGHKKNMLDKTYTHLGVAVEWEPKPKQGVWYFKATQNFAKL